MATIGANYPVFCPDEAEEGVVLGRLVSANVTINNATGELYADDSLAESASEFSTGSIAMQTDDLEDEKAKVIYGATVSEGLVTCNKDDTFPQGKLGYYKTIMRKGVKLFKCFLYPRAKAAIGNDNAQTKGSSITFQTENINWTISADDNGDWRKVKTVNTADEARSWLNEQCNISAAAAAAAVEGEEEPAAEE